MCNLFDLLFLESSKPLSDGSLSYGPGAEARLRLGEGQVTRNCKYKCLSFVSSVMYHARLYYSPHVSTSTVVANVMQVHFG